LLHGLDFEWHLKSGLNTLIICCLQYIVQTSCVISSHLTLSSIITIGYRNIYKMFFTFQAERREAVTEFVDECMRTLIPEEYLERERIVAAELLELAG
jgi:hypothetical protein